MSAVNFASLHASVLCASAAVVLQEQWIGYVLVCCFGVVFTIVTLGKLTPFHVTSAVAVSQSPLLLVFFRNNATALLVQP